MTVVHRVPTLTACPRPVRSVVLALPALCGSRARLRQLVAELSSPFDRIVVDCRGLVAGTRSFVDELVRIAAINDMPLEFVNLADAEFAGFIDNRRAVHQAEHLVTYTLRRITA